MEYKDDIPFHPSYGYATREQIQRLFDLKTGGEFNNLKKQVEFQNNKKGKVKGLTSDVYETNETEN